MRVPWVCSGMRPRCPAEITECPGDGLLIIRPYSSSSLEKFVLSGRWVSISQEVQVVTGLYERGMGTGRTVRREGTAESCEGFKSSYLQCQLSTDYKRLLGFVALLGCKLVLTYAGR